jgi:hypothetical protein
MNILDLLEKVTLILEELRIEYMISGSMAANIYTVARSTRDIDMIVNLKEENAAQFIRVFAEAFYMNEKTVLDEIKRKGFFNLINYETGYKIDFVILKDTEFRNEEFNRRIYTKINGFNAWVVSLEDLILSKLIWIQEMNSERQQSDIKSLLESSGIDFHYLKKWIEKLRINTFGLI